LESFQAIQPWRYNIFFPVLCVFGHLVLVATGFHPIHYAFTPSPLILH